MPAPLTSAQRFRYLPQEREDEVWGIFLLDAGSAVIPPQSAYPPPGHPEGYHFHWGEGRVLNEFQIIFVGTGQGVVETRRGGRRTVRAGQAFVLFPGEWHRYRPAMAVGWSETWAGFSGEYASHLMGNFFSATEPVISSAAPDELGRLMTELATSAAVWTKTGDRSLLGVRLLEVIAQLHRSRSTAAQQPGRPKLESARFEILTRAAERVNWLTMARRYGMSYATFRRRFKEMTGRSPLDYQIQVRVNRAAELLRTTPLTAREIADRLGYAHGHFFSRQFKKYFGKSPQNYREQLPPSGKGAGNG